MFLLLMTQQEVGGIFYVTCGIGGRVVRELILPIITQVVYIYFVITCYYHMGGPPVLQLQSVTKGVGC